jgi:hypothetical protein
MVAFERWDPRRTSIVASDTMQPLAVVPWWIDKNPGAKEEKNMGMELTSVIGSR